jgi:hypothetical protein
MALRQTRKISELEALSSASLQTTLVGVDNGTTYKVTLDVLEDAIISMVSRSTDLRLDSLEAYTASANAASDLSALNSYTASQNTLNSAFTNGINARLQTSSFNDFSASVHSEILAATNEQDLTPYITELVHLALSSSIDGRLDNLESNSGSYLTSLNGAISSSSQLTSSYDNRYVLSGSITQTTWDNIANKPNGIVSQSTDLSSLNSFTQSYFSDSASFNTRILAATNEQDLNNLEASASLIQSWNRNKEYMVGKSDQLTFSGDYVLDNAYLFVEGGQSNTIGEWTFETWDTNATYTPTGSNGYVITGPTGDTNASVGIWMHRQFDTETIVSVDYIWNGTDVGNDWPIYAVDTQYPYEIDTQNRLQDTNASSESGTWAITVPSGSWLSIGVNTANVNNTAGTLQVTLPYLFNSDMVEYSPNKYFKKEGKIFIGGNLLLKNGEIENNGFISVGGEVILIGNSQIYGTGTII